MTGLLSLRGIARALGGDAYPGRALVPGPGHGPEDRSLSISLSATNADGFIVNSFANDDWKVCRDHVKRRLGLGSGLLPNRRRDAPPARETRADALDAQREANFRKRAAAIVSQLVPIIGSPGERYLREVRRIDVDAIRDVLERSAAIGWHGAVFLHEPEHLLHRQLLGCIVGVMTDPVTALPTGAISRTYLGTDGKKVAKAKSLGQGGGVIRLSPDDEVLGGLHIAEGIETALTGMANFSLRPMWATGTTALMAKFPLLGGVECLNVIVDHDRNGAGERAAREVEARWRRAGREVRLLRSDQLGDLNDIIAGDEM